MEWLHADDSYESNKFKLGALYGFPTELHSLDAPHLLFGVHGFSEFVDRSESSTRYGVLGDVMLYSHSNTHRVVGGGPRSTFIDTSLGIEAGYVFSDNYHPSLGSDEALRLGATASLGVFFLEPSVSYAVEFYDNDELHELEIRMGILRPALPFGVFLGYRAQNSKAISEDAFIVGIEAHF